MQDSDKPVTTMDEILHPGHGSGSSHPDFPDAPNDWRLEQAMQMAKESGLDLTQDHLALLRALQHFFARHSEQQINFRDQT